MLIVLASIRAARLLLSAYHWFSSSYYLHLSRLLCFCVRALLHVVATLSRWNLHTIHKLCYAWHCLLHDLQISVFANCFFSNYIQMLWRATCHCRLSHVVLYHLALIFTWNTSQLSSLNRSRSYVIVSMMHSCDSAPQIFSAILWSLSFFKCYSQTNELFLLILHSSCDWPCMLPTAPNKQNRACTHAKPTWQNSSVEPSQPWVSNPSYVQTKQCVIKMPRAKNIARLGQRLIVAQGCYIPFVASPAALAT